jgi:hypothetical protein
MNSDKVSGSEPPPVRGLLRTSWEQREHWLGWDLVIAAVITAVGVVFVKSAVLNDVFSEFCRGLATITTFEKPGAENAT